MQNPIVAWSKETDFTRKRNARLRFKFVNFLELLFTSFTTGTKRNFLDGWKEN